MRFLSPRYAAIFFVLVFGLLGQAQAVDLSDAQTALDNHDYPGALTVAQAAIVEEPGVYPLYMLGFAQVKLGQLDAAEKTVQRIDPTERRAQLLRGEIAVARSDAATALKFFNLVLSAEPDDADALTGRGHAKFALNLDDRGRADLDRVIEKSDYATEALFLRGQLHAKAGEITKAALDFTKILSLLPGHGEARPLRAELYLQLKLRNLALSDIETLLESAPANSSFLALRARAKALPETSAGDAAKKTTLLLRQSAAALTKTDTTGALRAFENALLVAQDNSPQEAVEPHLYVARGDLLAAANAVELARDDYRAARYSGELIPPARLRLARLEFADKKFSDALEIIEGIDPGMGPHEAAEGLVLGVRFRIALAEESGDVDELKPAFESLKNARRLNPALGDIATAQNELAAAQTKLITARRKSGSSSSKLQGENLPAALAQAHELAKSDRFAASRSLYDRLLQLHPANPAIYEARLATAAEFGLNDPRSATLEAIVTELRAPAPALPATGTPDDLALARANLAVHERPYLSRPYIARARLHASRADVAYTVGNPAHASELAAALNDARLAIQLDAYDPQAHAALAEALIVQKRVTDILNFSARDNVITQAFASANRALALAPDDTELILWRGDLESAHGIEVLQRDSRALRFYARAIRSDPRSTRALYAHASASFKSGNNADAIADYRKVFSLEPDNLYARYELGVAQLYANAYTDAIATFSSLQQTLNASGDKTSADAIETHQLHAIALAAAGDDRSEALAKDVLTHSEWIGNADAALENLTQLALHAPQLDRLLKLTGTPNPTLPKTRVNQRETTLDASPR